jgi:hypothetical protein
MSGKKSIIRGPTECYTSILPNGQKITWFNESHDKWIGREQRRTEENRRK